MRDVKEGAHEFCCRIRPRLVGTLSFLCSDADVAEDLAQETLARVWVDWPKVRNLGDPAATAWTYRVAVNLANSWLRRKAAERRVLARLAAGTRELHIDADAAGAIDLRRAVALLPRRQRTALVLRYYSDLSVADVADLMGCATGTVKALTSQALSALRNVVPNDRGGTR